MIELDPAPGARVSIQHNMIITRSNWWRRLLMRLAGYPRGIRIEVPYSGRCIIEGCTITDSAQSESEKSGV